MAITYTLKVTQMDCLPQAEGQTDVVYCVHWAYTGTEGDRSAGFGGTTNLVYQQGSPFTPFDQLTETQVSEWVLEAWSADEKASREAAIASQLAIVAPPLPWPTSAQMDAPTPDVA